METSPAMGAGPVAVPLARAVSAGGNSDEQRERKQGDGQRQSGESCKCFPSHSSPPYVWSRRLVD